MEDKKKCTFVQGSSQSIFGFDEKRNLCIRDDVCVYMCVYVCDAACLHDILRREVAAVLILGMWMRHIERKNLLFLVEVKGHLRSPEVKD